MQGSQKDIEIFRKQLKSGEIQRAYRAILDMMTILRVHLQKTYPEYTISGLYQGYLDMSYFAIIPPLLKNHQLKIAIVFNYEAFRLEAWLSAANRQIQRSTWDSFKGSPWPGYRVVAPAKGIDSILEYDLVEDFSIDNPDLLTSQVEAKVKQFVKDIEEYLSRL